MKVIVIIPARYSSTRWEGKPLDFIDDSKLPMIQQVYEHVKMSEIVTDIIVATDDQRIYDAVLEFGGKAIMTSPDNRTGTDRVAEAADKMGLDLDDIVINVQGDQPRVVPQHLNDVVSPFMNEQGVEMSTLAFKIVKKKEIDNLGDCKVTFDSKGYAMYFSRSPIPRARDADTVFDTYKHLGIYAYTRRFLETFRRLPEGKLEKIEKLEQLRALEHGHRIRVVLTAYDSPEIDTPEDIARI
jgi:3-deoxy-manno-octulosonate cytidylyltransferase (CMP-KDO synthetase)